jgi:hypothetical protein
MPRIYDYEEYQNNKVKKVTTEYTFMCEIEYLDVNIINKPPELSNVDSINCEIEYLVDVDRNKKGIADLNFKVESIELEIETDDGPNEPDKKEFDVVPGENIPHTSVMCRKLSKLIPCEPSKLNIDMRKSMNPKDFKIDVFFGRDE